MVEHSRTVQCSIQFQRYSHLVLSIYCPVTLYIALLVRDCNLDIDSVSNACQCSQLHLPGICHPWQGCISSAHRADGVTDSGRMGLIVS
jgi:hypothetical protein